RSLFSRVRETGGRDLRPAEARVVLKSRRIRDLVHSPQRQPLVAIDPALMQALLVNLVERRREIEGRTLEIEGAPVSAGNVGIVGMGLERGGQEVPRPAAPEIQQGAPHVGQPEM